MADQCGIGIIYSHYVWHVITGSIQRVGGCKSLERALRNNGAGLRATFRRMEMGGVYMPGPPRKPTALRILEGNPSKRPLPKNEPKPDPSLPECPEWLMEEAKKEWNRVAPELNRLGLLTVLDRTALAAYCQSYAKWKQAEEFIQRYGTTYRTKKVDSGGQVYVYSQQHAEVGIANQCLKQIRAFCAEFGLTPASRARMELPSEREDDDFLLKLKEQTG